MRSCARTRGHRSSARCPIGRAHAPNGAGRPWGGDVQRLGASQLDGEDHGAGILVAASAGADPMPWRDHSLHPLAAGGQTAPHPVYPDGRAGPPYGRSLHTRPTARPPIRSPRQIRQKPETVHLVAHWVLSNLLPTPDPFSCPDVNLGRKPPSTPTRDTSWLGQRSHRGLIAQKAIYSFGPVLVIVVNLGSSPSPRRPATHPYRVSTPNPSAPNWALRPRDTSVKLGRRSHRHDQRRPGREHAPVAHTYPSTEHKSSIHGMGLMRGLSLDTNQNCDPLHPYFSTRRA